jgi:hypothetical protein
MDKFSDLIALKLLGKKRTLSDAGMGFQSILQIDKTIKGGGAL